MTNHRIRLTVTSYSWQILSLLLSVPCGSAIFTSEPRWGQAVALLNNQLFVHGGKTDQFNAFSYSMAPTSNDFFYLDLSSSFDPGSPPWIYISGSQEASAASQGPTLAWHSLSAYNSTQFLLFGGDGGPNSPVVLPSQKNSAILLDVSSTTNPTWTLEPESWANEPSRRIHHSTTTSAGKVYLIGGEKDDGSGLGYSDHYVFDPLENTFTQLPTDNGPPDIYGHTSILLTDGRLLVLGGYSQSSNELVPFTTIWSLDTQSSILSWSSVQVSDASVPPARRAFASTWVEGDSILIHGGADAELQSSLSDGWLLNTSSNPMTWINISTLSDLGQRRDHFAVSIGSQVVFGFGYAQNGGAPVSLSVFDLSQNAIVGSFTPQSTPSQTTLTSPSSTSSPNSSVGPGSGSSSSEIGPVQTTGSGSNGSGFGGSSDSDHKKSDTVAITVGSILGVLALASGAVVLVLVLHRQNQSRQQFKLISEDDTDSPSSNLRRGPPGAGWSAAWLGLGKGEKGRMGDQVQGRSFLYLGRKPQGNQRRIDMFAHEDSSGVFNSNVRRVGSGSSKSWYSIRETGHGRFGSESSRPTLGEMLSGSMHSLRSVGAAVRNTIGIRRVTSDGSGQSSAFNRLGEKADDDELPLDPFGNNNEQDRHFRNNANELVSSDNALQLPVARRLKSGKQEPSGDSRYSDPFKDQEAPQFLSSVPSDSGSLPYGEGGGHTLLDPYSHSLNIASSSRSTLSHSSQLPPLLINSSKSSSNTSPSLSTISITGLASSTSKKSRENLGALSISPIPRPRTLSIINTATSPSHGMKRSDSWWGRIKRASLRESVFEQTRQPSVKLDFEFRDPNPPPGRLSAIHERSGSGSSGRVVAPETSAPNSESHPSTLGSRRWMKLEGIYSSSGERSMTSLKTSRTADSGALERLGGRLDVAQREATGTSIDYTPSVSANSDGTSTFSGTGENRSRHPSEATTTYAPLENGVLLNFDEPLQMVESPTDDIKLSTLPSPLLTGSPLPSSSFGTSSTFVVSSEVQRSPAQDGPRSKRPHSAGAVAARVADYERRMTQELTSPTSPTKPKLAGTRHKSHGINVDIPEHGPKLNNTVVKYGLIQRPELFIANPDHRLSTSSNSQ